MTVLSSIVDWRSPTNSGLLAACSLLAATGISLASANQLVQFVIDGKGAISSGIRPSANGAFFFWESKPVGWGETKSLTHALLRAHYKIKHLNSYQLQRQSNNHVLFSPVGICHQDGRCR
jgi:hypothetical protein